MTVPLRVGLIGYGVSGAVFHAPLIDATPGLDLSTIVTSDATRRAAAAVAYPNATIVPDAAALWQDELDLVVIATPNRTHGELAEQAIAAGVPVLVDKPLAASSATAERIVAAAHTNGVPLTVYQNRRWDSDFLTVTAIMSAGRLGRLSRLESRFELYRPLNAAAWRESQDPDDGGGVLLDLGAHLIDQVMVLLGRPTSVYAEIHHRRDGAVVDDDAFVSLSFAGDVSCHLSMGKSVRSTGPRFRLIGSDADLVIDGTDPQWDALQRGERPGGPSWGRHPTPAVVTEGDGVSPLISEVPTEAGAYQTFYERLRDALLGRGPLPVDPLDAVEVLRVIEAARASAGQGSRVAFDVPVSGWGAEGLG